MKGHILGRGLFVRGVVQFLLFAAVLFAAFRYVADFSVRQSLVLIAAACLAYLIRTPLQTFFAYSYHFHPFFVHIGPNWDALLLDFGLVKDGEEYRQLWERMRCADEGRDNEGNLRKYNILRDGIMFTFLRWNKYSPFESSLIYRDGRRDFVTEIDFSRANR